MESKIADEGVAGGLWEWQWKKSESQAPRGKFRGIHISVYHWPANVLLLFATDSMAIRLYDINLKTDIHPLAM